MADYYEFLQISPNADMETIHRVYRFLAARFHPDNPASGNLEQFRLLKIAYDILSDTNRRAEYDTKRRRESPQPFSQTIDFMDTLEGELNRRMAVLAVLYHRRRTNALTPEVSLTEIEERMGFPRDYLDFTLWYLQKKGYISKADNAQFTLTADGVDFVETHREGMPSLNRMLTSGADLVGAGNERANGQVAGMQDLFSMTDAAESTPEDSFAATEYERRTGRRDRRVGAADKRIIKTERRGVRQRRANSSEQIVTK
jgi:curved DNA-binding protein